MTASKIEWTDATWNPVRGCAIVSKGCTNCYAMKQAHRFSGPGRPYEGLTTLSKGGPVWTGKVRTVPELLDAPLRWKKPRRIFVNSMSDLFHEDVPDAFLLQVFDVMRQCENGYSSRTKRPTGSHTFQILTKRPKRMLDFCRRLRFGQNDSRGMYLAADAAHQGFNPVPALKHVHLGVSVEDQASADERIPLLQQTPAAVRWVSAEPLLGSIDLREIPRIDHEHPHPNHYDIGDLDWLVTGGESGPGARPSHPDWFRSLRDQCAAAGVPFFFKQWGDWRDAVGFAREKNLPDERRTITYEQAYLTGTRSMRKKIVRVGKRAAGRLLDGRTHDEYPA